MKKLDLSFYTQNNVVSLAKELLGKLLVTGINGRHTAGRIVETEAYEGVVDKASHAYMGRKTARTAIMYATGGTAYVYLCYGIHHLFNVVTNVQGIPHAVLIRALEPLEGIPHMLERTGKPRADFTLTRGPGNVCKAMGISLKHNGSSLLQSTICLMDDGHRVAENQIIATPRIGVQYAAEHAQWPYRFIIADNLYISGTKAQNLKRNSD